jgi:Double-GTPase 2
LVEHEQGAEAPDVIEAEGDEEGAESQDIPEAPERSLITSNAALTFDEARRISGRRGARLVMLMGENKIGKTTLMAELWTWLISRGALAGHRFAGSRTTLAFEERAFLSRIAAGTPEPDTARTQEEDDGLLHLRIARPDGNRLDLLLTDYAGEHFTRIREGVPLLQELPWATRADRAAILLDGSRVVQPGESELAFNRATRQIYALEQSGALGGSARLAVLLVKDDLVSPDRFDAMQTRITATMDAAKKVDPDSVLIRVAARPQDGSDARGLVEVTEWMCGDDRARAPYVAELPRAHRAISRLRA